MSERRRKAISTGTGPVVATLLGTAVGARRLRRALHYGRMGRLRWYAEKQKVTRPWVRTYRPIPPKVREEMGRRLKEMERLRALGKKLSKSRTLQAGYLTLQAAKWGVPAAVVSSLIYRIYSPQRRRRRYG